MPLRRLTYVGRGLKSENTEYWVNYMVSPHIRGARIEIKDSDKSPSLILSPHIRGARIEIRRLFTKTLNKIVASHTWGED